MDAPRDRGATLQGRTHVSHVDTLAGINEMDPPLCGAVVISQTEVSQTDH